MESNKHQPPEFTSSYFIYDQIGLGQFSITLHIFSWIPFSIPSWMVIFVTWDHLRANAEDSVLVTRTWYS